MPKLMKPSFSVVCETPNMLDVIEDAARKCYLSEPKCAPKKSIADMMEHEDPLAREFEQRKFLKEKITLGHHSILEHGNITVDFVFDRGVSHEEVRHRLQAISQESTRYCNYSKDKYDNEIAVIEPFFFDGTHTDKDENSVVLPELGGPIRVVAALTDGDYIEDFPLSKLEVWEMAMKFSEWAYLTLIHKGATAQEARSVLPNSLKTEMRVTMNVREWRHVLKIRTEKGVHPQMAEVMVPTLCHFKDAWPVLFEDINHDPKWDFFLEVA